MRRKKSAKRAIKRQSVNNALTNVQKMEKQWQQAPVKFAADLKKDIAAQSKQEAKLQKSISKLQNAIEKSESRIAKLSKAKNLSAAQKKQIKATEKELAKMSKAHADTFAQLQAISKSLDELLTAQSKFIALDKYLVQFEKEWNKYVKAAKAKTTAKKTKKAAKRKLSVVEDKNNSADESADNAALDEATELAS